MGNKTKQNTKRNPPPLSLFFFLRKRSFCEKNFHYTEPFASSVTMKSNLLVGPLKNTSATITNCLLIC